MTAECGETQSARRVAGQFDFYRCSREPGHGGQHHGRHIEGGESFMTWPTTEEWFRQGVDGLNRADWQASHPNGEPYPSDDDRGDPNG